MLDPTQYPAFESADDLTLGEVAEILKPDDFHSSAHARIYEARFITWVMSSGC